MDMKRVTTFEEAVKTFNDYVYRGFGRWENFENKIARVICKNAVGHDVCVEAIHGNQVIKIANELLEKCYMIVERREICASPDHLTDSRDMGKDPIGWVSWEEYNGKHFDNFRKEAEAIKIIEVAVKKILEEEGMTASEWIELMRKKNADFGINEYGKMAIATAIYPRNTLVGLFYSGLALAAESGEVAGVVSKIIRDDNCVVTEAAKIKGFKELGDVGWQWIACCYEFGFNPAEVLKANIAKLNDRKERGVLKGSGDER